MIDGVAAANWLLNYGRVEPSMCLKYVWLAYKAQGAWTSHASVPRATDAWEASDGKRWGDRNPPAGAAVWWGRRRSDGNYDGDVVISLGGGRVAVTEAPGMGSVTGACTLDERERQINRDYLGWTSSIFDCPISLPGVGKDAIPATPGIPAPDLSEEDDDMMKPTLFSRGTTAFDGSLIHPDFGVDLKPGESRVTYVNDGDKQYVVRTFRGFMVTDSPAVFKRWAYMYAPTLDLAKVTAPGTDVDKAAAYIGVQAEATRVSLELHGDAQVGDAPKVLPR